MSARYVNSPSLHLKIGKSRLRAALYCALCLVCSCALWLLFARGYVVIVLLLAVLASFLLWRLRNDPLVGAELRWCQGVWTLEHEGIQRVILPTSRSTMTPWVIYLAFRELPASGADQLWLYADGACSQQLRRLRVRLTVDR